MTRAEIITELRKIRTPVAHYAASMLEADGGRTHYDAAAVERARIREALRAEVLIAQGGELGPATQIVTLAAIERICAPQAGEEAT